MVLDSCVYGDEISVEGKVQARYYGEMGKKIEVFYRLAANANIWYTSTHFRYHYTLAKNNDMAREMMMFLFSVP